MGQNQNNTGKFASIFGKRRIAQSQPVSMIMDNNVPVAPVKKKAPIIPIVIIAAIVIVIIVVIIFVINKIKKDQNDMIFNVSQEYSATLYNNYSASEYHAFLQGEPDAIENSQNWLISRLLNSGINENIDDKRSLAVRINTKFEDVNSVYSKYPYKNEKTDEVIQQNAALKDVLILYLTAGKKDSELKSYYSDKEIDNDIEMLQEKYNSGLFITKSYYSTLLNYRKNQKKYLNWLSRNGCLNPSGIDMACAEYVPKDDKYGAIKAQYNTSVHSVKQQSDNLSKLVVNATRLLNGIGL